MTLRDASKAALEMLRVIQAADADHDVRDPDLAAVIDALAHALHPKLYPAPPYAGSQRQNKHGFERGQRLLVVGGKLDGHVVRFDRVSGGDSVYVTHGDARVSVRTDLLETV
jgi:hypothetical protein